MCGNRHVGSLSGFYLLDSPIFLASPLLCRLGIFLVTALVKVPFS